MFSSYLLLKTFQVIFSIVFLIDIIVEKLHERLLLFGSGTRRALILFTTIWSKKGDQCLLLLRTVQL